MIVIPAIDLREGACVQLVGGSYEDERVRLADPLAVAARWSALGFRRLHVVDLDAATGRGDQRALVRRLIEGSGLEVQAGGGVRDERAIEELLAAGAAAVIVGTRAIRDPEWLAVAAGRFPGKLLVAADARGGEIVVEGWARGAGVDLLERLRALDPLPLAGVLVTVVDREGRVEGTDLELLGAAIAATRHPVHAAGGIAGADEIERLERLGAHAVVLGMGLYTGALDAGALAKGWGA